MSTRGLAVLGLPVVAAACLSMPPRPDDPGPGSGSGSDASFPGVDSSSASGCLASESSLPVFTPPTAYLDALFDRAGLNEDPMLGRLHIRVVDCAGTPVEGAAFELTQSMGMPVGELIPNARSYLGAGTYFVHDIPPGATRVVARYSGMTFLAPTIPIAAGVTASVVIRPGY